MIWLSRKDEFKRILLTLNTRTLEFIGAFQFIAREKKIIKLHEAEIPQYCLYLSTETGEYGSTVCVSKEKYKQARVNEPYGLCSVIKNIRYGDFFIVADITEPVDAIRKTARNSWGKMIFFLIVCCLCFGSVILLMLPLLHITLN